MKIRVTKKQMLRTLQTSLAGAGIAVLASLSFFAGYYIRTSPRFDVKVLSVSGLDVVNENLVVSQANSEIGKNVFSVDLDEVRQRVEGLPWVRFALVRRVVPDRIAIKVIEREPIGIARIQGRIYQFDADAMVLDPDGAALASFPVLHGLQANDAAGNVRKIELYRQVLAELGQNELSEVHIDERGEVSVVSASDPLVVDIGSDEFRVRWMKYLQLKTQIHRDFPHAVRIDLRFGDIIVSPSMRDDNSGERVTWQGERRSL